MCKSSPQLTKKLTQKTVGEGTQQNGRQRIKCPDRQGDVNTDRQTDRQRDRQTDREICRKMLKQTRRLTREHYSHRHLSLKKLCALTASLSASGAMVLDPRASTLPLFPATRSIS